MSLIRERELLKNIRYWGRVNSWRSISQREPKRNRKLLVKGYLSL